MSLVAVPVAYMPLVDAAPLIIAQEMGFAKAEGIALETDRSSFVVISP